MNTFLDALCSSWLIGAPVLIVGFLLICFLMFKVRFKNEKLNSFLMVMFVLLIPALLFVFSYFAGSVYGFGYATNFKDNRNNQKWLCYVSEGTFKMHTRGGGSDEDCRLNVLDPKTGERLQKKVIGYFSKAIKLRGDTLFYKASGSSYTLFDVSKGTEIANLAPSTLPGLYKEFSSGVEVVKYDEYSGLLKASAKDGRTYYINPFTMQLSAEKRVRDYTPKKNQLSISYNEMDLDSVHTIKLIGQNSDDKLLRLATHKEKILNEELGFLYGEFLANLPRKKQFLILSYETTDKSNFILNCISSDGYKLLWQVKQSDLDANDFFTKDNVTNTRRYNYTAKMEYADVVGESFVFAIQGFVFSIDLNSGKLNWKTRL